MNLTSKPEINRLVSEREKIDEQLVKEICSTTSFSKTERLQMLETYGLIHIHGCIKYPLRDKYIEQLKEAAIREGATYFIDDSWPFINNDYVERRETINLADELMCTLENLDDPTEEIVVLRDRGTGAEIKISYEQLESDVYDWCLQNKQVGFKFDW